MAAAFVPAGPQRRPVHKAEEKSAEDNREGQGRSVAHARGENGGQAFVLVEVVHGSKEVVESTPPLNQVDKATLSFYLKPIGIVFEKGSRLRVAITGADADFHPPKTFTPAPDITVFSGGRHNTKISLPIFTGIEKLQFKTWADSL